MADLQVAAPLACGEYDNDDDWNDFSESQSEKEDCENSNCQTTNTNSNNHANTCSAKTQKEINQINDQSQSDNSSAYVNASNGQSELTDSYNSEDLSFMDSFLEKGKSGSLEDLVNTFDKKLSECFADTEYKKDNVSNIAPVQVRSQEDIINGCQTWLTLTGTYGNALPLDWSKCYIKELQTKSLHLLESPRQEEGLDLDLSDDEELKEAFDVHAIVSPMVPRTTDEQDINADDVIDEIDTIMKMQDSMNTDDTGYITEPDMLTSAESDSIHFKDVPSPIDRVNLGETEVQQLTIRQLNDMVEELNTEINVRSALLVQEYSYRDDIRYERELKNTFISMCDKVMKKQKAKKRRKPKLTETATSISGTTYVVPYQLSQMPPSNDLLLVYIKILKAIHNDSPNVPAMLTEYILKVVCPTS